MNTDKLLFDSMRDEVEHQREKTFRLEEILIRVRMEARKQGNEAILKLVEDV